MVWGNGKEITFDIIEKVLGKKRDILVEKIDFKKEKKVEKFVSLSQLPILILTHIGEIPHDKDFFAGEREKTKEIRKYAKKLPPFGYLILNYDDETIREIRDETNLREITFGFANLADFKATDIKINSGTNFKLNFENKILPIWLENLFGKEYIFAVLATCALCKVLNLNLIEITQSLKGYKGRPGKMRLICGIKNSKIFDNSKIEGIFSIMEALEIFKKISLFKRKIAVLGDIVGLGKYTIEIHQMLGEKLKECCDLLFTFGQRAKFVAKGAFEKGLPLEKIFQFDTIKEGIEKLKNEIRENDLILVLGSKEMKMESVVEKIKLK